MGSAWLLVILGLVAFFMMVVDLAHAPHGRTDVSCMVSCVDKFFTSGSREGEPVCGFELCGKSTPFIGLDTFGCSDDMYEWAGSCCNTNTCDGWRDTHEVHTGASICRRTQVCEIIDLPRRTDEVMAVCCDEGGQDCSSGAPSTCSAACADVLLPFVDDCRQALGKVGVQQFSSVVSSCAAALEKDDKNPAIYELDVEYSGPSFADGWYFMEDRDPTGGCVKFVGRDQATAANLVGYDTRSREFYIKADAENMAFTCGGDGRQAVRMASKKTWRSGGLFAIDLSHMPSGCGTWPAFWLVASPCGHKSSCSWPIQGEIDIIEGANLQTRVQTTLHAKASESDCKMEPQCALYPNMTGTFHSHTNCDASLDGNAGCAIFGAEGTYGEPLNKRGGGVIVTQWLEHQISAWFFPHGEEPPDLIADAPRPHTWPAPYAAFPLGANCDGTHFEDLQLVYDTTFCGGFAGQTYAATCADEALPCHTANSADTDVQCFETINTVRGELSAGGAPDPRYGGCLSGASSAVEIQAVLFALRDANCVRPCGIDMDEVCVPQDSAATAECADASPACLKNIAWMRSNGLVNHPEWYAGSGLTTTSSDEAMQAWLHHLGSSNDGDCALPCNVHALDLQFEAVRPSWLKPDVHKSPGDVCNQRVLWQPEQFTEAYWQMSYVKVFTQADTRTTCTDGKMNGGEEGIDCGGPCADPCPDGMTGDGETCIDPLPGEPCRVNVEWVLADGVVNNPEWYKGSGLTRSSDPRAVQAWLHHLGPGKDGGCDRLPCGDLTSLALPFDPYLADDPRAPSPAPGFCSGETTLSDRMDSLTAACETVDDVTGDKLSCTHTCVHTLRDFIDDCELAISQAGISDHLEQQIRGCGSITAPETHPGGGVVSGSCDVTCVGRTFTAGNRKGEAVCSHELCGSTVPYVGLDTFGCSDQSVFWGGHCCNVQTCK